MQIFDAHFHIIDFDFPIIENDGYMPPSFNTDAYQRETAHFNVVGGQLYRDRFKDSTKNI